MEEELKRGDRVSFEIEGNPAKPFGFGVVMVASKGKTLIQPDHNLTIAMVMKNIRKVSQ